ncbi:MAG: histidinol-phosphate transaminase [Chloroflexota bacterium]
METLKLRSTQAASPIYQGGKPISHLADKFGLDVADINKLGSNENPLPTPDSVKSAIQQAAAGLNRYPPSVGRLREQLAIYLGQGVNAENIVIGNGGCDVLNLIAASFIEPGDEAIICRPTFPVYELTLKRLGASMVYADLNDDFSYSVERILAAVTPKTRLLYLTTPNNPTGSILTKAEQAAIMSQLPDHVLVVADEVYWQFNDHPDRNDSLHYVREGANIVVLHSFSKLMGLAGLRIGYGIAPVAIAEYLQRGQLPFHINALSIAAGMAAIADRDYLEATIDLTLTERPRMLEALQKIDGIEAFPSAANFILVKPEMAGPALDEALQREGIIVRDLSGFYMPGYLRVSVGQADENEALLEKLEKVLG